MTLKLEDEGLMLRGVTGYGGEEILRETGDGEVMGTFEVQDK